MLKFRKMPSVLPSLLTEHSINKHVVISPILKNKTLPWPLNFPQLLAHFSSPLTVNLLERFSFSVSSNSFPSLSGSHVSQVFVVTTPPNSSCKGLNDLHIPSTPVHF